MTDTTAPANKYTTCFCPDRCLIHKPHTKDGRNIVDKYFFWNDDDIREDLNSKRFKYSVMCCNIVGDYNIGSVIRSANVFLAKEVIIFGRKRYNRHGTVGMHSYENFKFVKEISDLDQIFSNYDLVIGIDNVENAEPIDNFDYKPYKNVLFVFGEERAGIPQDVLTKCNKQLYVRQFGCCRSLNVASCASIVMHDFVTKAAH